MNHAIREYLQPDDAVLDEAQEEIEEFDNAFTIVHNEDDKEGADKKQRVYWRDIIEREERKAREAKVDEEGVEEEQPAHVEQLTESQAARIKEGKGDDEDDSIKQIGSVNPIDDFGKMITDRKTDRVSDAIRQMQAIIERYIRQSLNGDLYEKALECLIALRKACVTEDEAPIFNKFLEKVKDLFAHGPSRAFFQLLVNNNLSLITKGESAISSIVTDEQARNFLKLDEVRPQE